MRRLFSEKTSRWLLPVVLFLFILEVLLLPVVLGITYSGRSETPTHILTYTKNKLTWDNSVGIEPNGAAKLDLFHAQYPDAESGNGENVVAPGTEGYSIVRLKNDVDGSVDYTAVLYCIRTDEQLPVQVALEGSSFEKTQSYLLPDGVQNNHVIRAVTGTIRGGEILDFDISWLWDFEKDDTQNVIDTFLANKDNADRVSVGLYIQVEDDNIYKADIPQTGDDQPISMYFVLMGISLAVLLLLLWDRRKEKKCS